MKGAKALDEGCESFPPLSRRFGDLSRRLSSQPHVTLALCPTSSSCAGAGVLGFARAREKALG